MSVMLLPDSHINLLVSYCSKNDIRYFFKGTWHKIEGNEQDIAKRLYNVNLTAFNVRYKETNPADKFVYKPVELRGISAIQIVKAAHCYEYQCEDWGLWDESFAKDIIERIKGNAVTMIPEYDDAKWVWGD